MPARSAKQQRYMGACLSGKAKGKCPPKKVARKYARKPRGGYRR